MTDSSGRCEFCGHVNAGHRVWDAMASRVKAGEGLDDVAEDYGVTLMEAERMVGQSNEDHPPFRVLICGSRDWHDRKAIEDVVCRLFAEHLFNLTVIHGAAPGADTIAGELAAELEVYVLAFPADWRHGRASGPIRNQKMLDEGAPHEVYAFMSTPDSRGTQDMVRRARKAGLPVTIIEPDRHG